MFNSEFWTTVIAILGFVFGMIIGMLIDYLIEKWAAQKAQIKQNEAEIRKLKAKLSFYKSLLEEKDGRQDM